MPYRALNAGIIITGSEVYNGRIKDRFEPVVTKKLSYFPGGITGVEICDDDMQMIINSAKELMEKGETCDIKEVEKEIAERDYRDMHRENSPLIKVEDAVLIDSSNLTIDETIDSILDIVIKR